MALSSGTRLGAYEILGLLGSGGMGEVYRATDTNLKRQVAIKVLPAAVAGDPDRLARLQREAEVLAALNHPNIAHIFGLERASGTFALVMELVEGPTLEERIARGAIPLDEVLPIARQIAEALESAHAQGIIHRDLKPANIKVSSGGMAKLLDFGLASPTSADLEVTRTTEGTVLGTAAYMAPEQAEGQRLDVRSDVFSLGAVLYEMLSGSRAFGGTTMVQVLGAVLREDPPPLRTPPAMDRIVRRCLQKEPSQRFQTMSELRVALEQTATAMASKPADAQPSIAVLPFVDMSAGKDHEWFSDGLAEEIINALAHMPGLTVIARTSAFAFKGKQEDIRRIAEALGVANVLEGSVRRAGHRVRVTAQLVAAANGAHLWSERYDRDMEDVFAIQDDIAQSIAAALQVKLSVPPAALRRHTPTLPAYEAYLKAMYYLQEVTPERLGRCREYLEQAIALDPEFALAHSALSMYFFLLGYFSQRPAREAMPLTRAAARRALDLDPSLPETHALLGAIAAVYDYDWKEAESRFRLATARPPVSPSVHMNLGFYLATRGRLSEAIDAYERVLKADPVNILGRQMLSTCLAMADRPVDRLRELRRILELDELNWVALAWVGVDSASRGMLPEGLDLLEKAHRLGPEDPVVMGLLAGFLVRAGNVPRSDAVLQQLRDGPAHGTVVGFLHFHLVCDEIDAAADWAEKAIEQRHPAILIFLRMALATGLRSSARWPALAKMTNLAETSRS